jgi:hypothetical protein
MYDYVTRKAPKGCTFCRKHPAFSQGEALELNNSGSQEATFAQSLSHGHFEDQANRPETPRVRHTIQAC